MSTYDNPRPVSQPVGSTEPVVAKDNLITFDRLVNAPAGEAVTNRKGEKLLRPSDLLQYSIADNRGAYTANVSIYRKGNDTFTFGGQEWAVDPKSGATFPYTATQADPANDPNLQVWGDVTLPIVQNEIYRSAPKPWIPTAESGVNATPYQRYTHQPTGGVAIEVYTTQSGVVMGSQPIMINDGGDFLSDEIAALRESGDVSGFETVQQAFDYALTSNITVTSKENIRLSSTVYTHGVPFDFSNITVTVESGFSGQHLFSCTDPEKQVIEGFDLGEYKDWQVSTQSLSGFGVCTAMIVSSEDAFQRAGGSKVKKCDILNLSNGYHPTTPAFFDISTPVQLTILPRRNQISIGMPTVVFEDQSQEITAILLVERNDVSIFAGYEQLLHGEIMRAFILARGVTKLTINGAVTSFQDSSFGYLVDGFCCNNVIVEKCNVPSGWRAVDGNFLKNVTCLESESHSFGAHAMVYNFTADRCKTYGGETRGGGINVMGRGLLSVTNHHHTVTSHDATSTVNTQYAVSTRADYGQAWDGDIEISNVNVLVSGVVTGEYRVLDVAVSLFDGALNFTGDNIAGKNISISNVGIDNKSGSPMSLSVAKLSTAFKQPIVLPETYRVSNVTLSGDFDYVNYMMFGAQTNPNCRQTLSKFYVENVTNPTQQTEFTVLFGSNRDQVKNRIEYDIRKHDGLRCKFNMPSGYKIIVRESTVKEFDCDVLADEDFGKYELGECVITAQNIGCGARGGSSNVIMKLYENEFTYRGPIKMGHGIKLCSGNVAPAEATLIGGGPSSGDTLWSTRAGFLQ